MIISVFPRHTEQGLPCPPWALHGGCRLAGAWVLTPGPGVQSGSRSWRAGWPSPHQTLRAESWSLHTLGPGVSPHCTDPGDRSCFKGVSRAPRGTLVLSPTLMCYVNLGKSLVPWSLRFPSSMGIITVLPSRCGCDASTCLCRCGDWYSAGHGVQEARREQGVPCDLWGPRTSTVALGGRPSIPHSPSALRQMPKTFFLWPQ